jgi:hypothetical protein
MLSTNACDKALPFLNHFRHQKRQVFEYITRDWPEAERLEFARLLLKYADSTAQLPAPGAVNRPRESLAGHQRIAKATAAGDP